MHELTLAESVIQIVENAANRANAKKVTRVRLSIGALAHVDSDTILYCCDIVSRGSVAEGAVFEVDRPLGKALCNACGKHFMLEKLYIECPHCKAHNLQVHDGEQMKVVEISIP